MFQTLIPIRATVLLGLALTTPNFAQQVGPLPPSADPTLNVGSVGAQPVAGGNLALGGSSGFDNFNRADGPLGADWTPMVNNFEIRNNQFSNVGSVNGWSLYNAATSLYENAVIEFDLTRNPAGLAYGAAITGGGGSDNTFTKIQGSANYTNVGFYHGSNAGSIGGYGGFFTITPVTGGRVRVYVTNGGDTMNADIDEDIDGVFEYHYESSGLLSSGLVPLMGDGVGLGSFSDVGPVDNFSANGAGPEPVLQVTEIVPDQFITFDISNMDSGSTAVLVLSSVGPGPTVTPYGEIEVSLPWRRTPLFPADANGVVNFTSTLPPGASGATFYMQAVEFKDDATTSLTNSLVVPLP
ncbi:MAG: hypothetical protein COA70_09065 [Planctomycetota bacterium]|nr:MAG: hypothetical protein COA70_09065 [Planctomycetota bacterium]